MAVGSPKIITNPTLAWPSLTQTDVKTDLVGASDAVSVTQGAVARALTGLVVGSGNVMNALSITSYGGVSNAVEGAGLYATGTNNTTPFNNMCSAAQAGQLCVIPAGGTGYRFQTAPNAFGSKKARVWILAPTYHDGVDFIRVVPPGGVDRHHEIIHWSVATGRLISSMPSHNKTNYDNNTGPDWAAFTGRFITVTDSHKCYFAAVKVVGFQDAFCIQGSADGSQEHTFAFKYLDRNAVGIHLMSVDGTSYVDKNVIIGMEGGLGRISGGVGLFIDGYAPANLFNGETWNGAARSNRFYNLLFERVDIGMKLCGDISEPVFVGCCWEGGTTTGTFSGTTVHVEYGTGANYLRQASFIACSVVDPAGFTGPNDFGVSTRFVSCGFWLNQAIYFGTDATVDDSGRLNIVAFRTNISLATMSNLPANVKLAPFNGSSEDVTFSSGGSYSLLSTTICDHIIVTNGTGVNLHAANLAPGRRVCIVNDQAGTSVLVGGLASGWSMNLTPKTRGWVRVNKAGTGWFPD